MLDLTGKSVLVLGAGGSGVAAARLALSKGAEVSVLDTGTSAVLEERMKALRQCGAKTYSGKDALAWHSAAELVIFSPGVPIGSPLGQLGYACSQNRTSELAFGASFISCPVLAITGTNGKTTTVEMLEHCLNAAGHEAIAAGNIGLPLSEVALSGKHPEFIVAETSSFQLEHVGNFSPTVSALLNITPDHLSRHGSMENYIRTKLAVFNNSQKKNVINAETMQIETVSKTFYNTDEFLTFSVRSDLKADYSIVDGFLARTGSVGRLLVKVSDLPFSGNHNLENALAVLAVCEAAGLDVAQIAKQLCSFHTGAHRLQVVAENKKYTFIDDSKATNVDAVIKALGALIPIGRPIALIAGGIDKGCELGEVIPLLERSVSSVSLIGQCKERLYKSWGKYVTTVKCNDMADAVAHCVNSLPEGGIVLLSPACASQDMYRDYAHRGDVFAECAKKSISE